MFTPFQNEPLVNFNDERPQRKMTEALARVSGELGKTYPLAIGEQRIETTSKTVSRNPARLAQVVGTVCDAPIEMAEHAVSVAEDAFKSWSRTTAEYRARILVKAAAMLRRRIYEFSSWLVCEASKTWTEAYADAAEAIDFLEFYARDAVHWAKSQPTTPYPGEENELTFIPLGVGVVIAPWNFPLAIMAGMASAAIVAGNTVVLKPSELTPVIAARFCDLMDMAGLPPGVLNFVPGPGGTVGEALTGNPNVRFVTFTGSKDVGLHINQRIASQQRGQRWIKRGIFEMGGKDAIIVDHDVNLEGAAMGVVEAAFGFQGQKCSACSRLIAHSSIYDALVAKVVERASRLVVGDPANKETNMGAVIDSEAYKKILSYIAIGRSEGRLVLGGGDTEDDPEGGHFIHPTIFADVPPTARIAQEEIFGPVLSIIRAEDFDEALEIANGTQYGLTGGVYSNSRRNVERARSEFRVGNLYLNRKCTGALVGVQPFGGFNLSGTNSKAGSHEYLLNFLQAKSVTERW